jgi:hypothetical protein
VGLGRFLGPQTRSRYSRSGLLKFGALHARLSVDSGFHDGNAKQGILMCRNIKRLHNFQPPATEEEIRASSIQYVRKLSGFALPSKVNEAPFARAVEQVAQASRELLDSLVTTAPPRDRDLESARAAARVRSK